MKKKYLMIFLSLLMALGFTSCSNNNQESEVKISSIGDLINSLDYYKKQEEEKKLEQARLEEEKAKKIEAENKKEEEKIEDKFAQTKRKQAEKEEEKPKKSDIRKVKLKAFGDIMAHMAQIQYAYNKGGGEYDFSEQFIYMKEFIEDSDIAIGNYETTTNPDLAYA